MKDLGLVPDEARRRRSFWAEEFPCGFLMWSARGGGRWHMVRRGCDDPAFPAGDTGEGAVEPVLLRLSAEGRLASPDPAAFLDSAGRRWLYWALS